MSGIGLILNIMPIIAVVYAFSQILMYDEWDKKLPFILALIITIFFLQNNSECARTAPFLLQLICLQILMMGVVMRYKQQIIAYVYRDINVKKQKGKINQQAVIFTCMLVILSLSSAIGLGYSIYADYYLQLYSDDLAYMLLIIFVGFVLVALADYLYKSIKKQQVKNSARRKIFHFVPSILFPILASINYKLFTLIAFGFFYLFWLVENGRYFGKLARKQQQRIQKYANEYKIIKLEDLPLDTNKLLFSLTHLTHRLNVTLSKLSFFQWMESLNQARQPYFWFTHLSLIVGLCVTYVCYGPSWNKLQSQRVQTELKQNISVILTLADAMAAIIGSKYGKKQHIVPFSNKKTIQGYVGYVITAGILQITVYLGLSVSRHQPIHLDYIFIAISSGMCGLGELFSGDMDNIVCGMIYIAVDASYTYLISA